MEHVQENMQEHYKNKVFLLKAFIHKKFMPKDFIHAIFLAGTALYIVLIITNYIQETKRQQTFDTSISDLKSAQMEVSLTVIKVRELHMVAEAKNERLDSLICLYGLP